MNGEVCCILQICCSEEARALALAKEMVKDGVCKEREEALMISQFIFRHFDLAPAGTLGPFVTAVAKIAKEHKP